MSATPPATNWSRDNEPRLGAPSAQREGMLRVVSCLLHCSSVTWDRKQIPEGAARIGRIWRIFILEESRLRLFHNSASRGRGGSCERRGNAAIALVLERVSSVVVVRNRPAVANMPDVRICFNVLDPQIVSAEAPVETRVDCSSFD
jgi:hypothetical protein